MSGFTEARAWVSITMASSLGASGSEMFAFGSEAEGLSLEVVVGEWCEFWSHGSEPRWLLLQVDSTYVWMRVSFHWVISPVKNIETV